MSLGLINRVRPDLSIEQIVYNVEDIMNNPDQFDITLQRKVEVILRGVRDLRA